MSQCKVPVVKNIVAKNIAPTVKTGSKSGKNNLIQLTIPFEDAIDKAFERKKLKATRLASIHKTSGDRCSTLLLDFDFGGLSLKVVESEAAEKASQWVEALTHYSGA